MSRKQEQITQAKKEKIKKTITWLVILGVIFGGFALLMYTGIQQKKPQGPDLSQSIEIGENAGQHVATSTELELADLPPTSGAHFGQVATAGLRDKEIPDGHIVHNLEHGDIWISYNPRVGADITNELKQFLDGKVIITPRSSNRDDIALAAWGQLDSFNLDDSGLPIERIEDFIKRYKYAGPEKITSSSRGI